MTMLRTLLPLALLALPGLADKVDDVLKVWDANKDGVLTRDEIPDAAIFAKVDKNKDGKATRAEVAAFLGIEQPKKKDRPKNKSGKSTTEAKIKTPRTTREHVADFFRRYDKDKNRKVTKKEVPTGQNVFRDWDRNKDDALTRREVERYIKAELRRLRMRPNANNFFELFDFNRDKKVTRKEYTGPRDFFRRYDHDKNGAVTEKEISMGPDQGRASTRVMRPPCRRWACSRATTRTRTAASPWTSWTGPHRSSRASTRTATDFSAAPKSANVSEGARSGGSGGAWHRLVRLDVSLTRLHLRDFPRLAGTARRSSKTARSPPPAPASQNRPHRRSLPRSGDDRGAE